MGSKMAINNALLRKIFKIYFTRERIFFSMSSKMAINKVFSKKKKLEHILRINGFSSVYFEDGYRLCSWEKPLKHISKMNRFSLVYILKWPYRCSFRKNLLEYIAQLNGLSFLCSFTLVSKVCLKKKKRKNLYSIFRK